MTTLTYYVALPFLRADDGTTVPGEAIECPNAATAILQAEILSQAAGNVGAIALAGSGVPARAIDTNAAVPAR